MVNRGEMLAKTTKQLCMTSPFYGMFLMMLNKRWSEAVPTMGVSKNGINYQLDINEVFWDHLEDKCRSGVLQHEALHIAFFHLERQAEFEDKKIMNWAMDMEINQYIPPDNLPTGSLSLKQYQDEYGEKSKQLFLDYQEKRIDLSKYLNEIVKIPGRPVFIKDFPELHLEEKKGTKYYYDILMQNKDKKPKDKGYCKHLGDMMRGSKEGEFDPNQHDWKDFENLSEADKKLLRAQTNYQLREVRDQILKGRGTLPGEMEGYLKGLDKKDPPKFNWKAYLRRFAGGSQKVFTKKLHRKYNKRFDENPGLKIKAKRHILVAPDLSGSMSDKEVKIVFHEVYHIHKMGSEVSVMQFDAAIYKPYTYRKSDEDNIKIHGRGGTDYQPVINYYNENKHKYSCLIILTDGECPVPVGQKGKVLWVLTPNSKNEGLQPQIKLN